MAYLQIDEDRIPVGNYAFLADVTGDEELFSKFYEAEKNIKVDYIDFAHKIRMAFEGFAVLEECKRRKGLEEYADSEVEEIKEGIIEEIKQPASLLNYKGIVISLCDGRETEFKEMLVKYSFLKANAYEEESIRRFKAFIRFLYAFGSESSHENVKSEEKYIPNKENCIRVAGAFHDFLGIYYGVIKKYDSTLIPIRDYVAVPKAVVEKIGMTLDVGKSLFVKEKRGKIGFYIFSSDIDSISDGQRRDIDTISKLWDENFEDPSNVIRQVESINGSKGDYRFQVYSLPGRPLRLTKEFVDTLSIQDRKDIIAGLCRGIESLHNYDSPMYHRNINPDAFYIFNVKGKYKPLLAKFDCTKDNDNASFTVYQNVEKKALNQNTNVFFAPEVISSQMGIGVDWEKADIYSLAKTSLFILTGKVLDTIDDYDVSEEIDDELLLILMEMMDMDSTKRANIEDLIKILYT
ncbi:MAG TPA: serine/threonine protein kinase [Eubacterium sp.]|nr:serine/threonine protein kinase [Eubacterium sp.]